MTVYNDYGATATVQQVLPGRAGRTAVDPVRRAQAGEFDPHEICQRLSDLNVSEALVAEIKAGRHFFSEPALRSSHMWVCGNEISRLDYVEETPDGRTIPGYLMPRDTSQDPVRVEHSAHHAILVVLAYVPPRTFDFSFPASRGEGIAMVRRQLQDADPALDIYAHNPGKDALFHLVGNPAGTDHARSPLFVSCWMLNNEVLQDFLLRKRELLFAGGTVSEPAREPVRICHLPGEASASGGILGIPLAAQYGFRIFPNLMHERIICDMVLSYFQTLAGSCITAVLRHIDWEKADQVHGKTTPPCSQPTTKFMVVSTEYHLLRILRNVVDQAGGLAFWFQSPLRMLAGADPRHDPAILPCRIHLTEDFAQAADRAKLDSLSTRRYKVDFYLKRAEAVSAALDHFPLDKTAGVLSGRFLNSFRAAHAALPLEVRESVATWAPALANMVAWPDSGGLFDGTAVTISFTSEEARIGFLKWTMWQQRLSMEGLPTATKDLWAALPHRLCNETGLNIFIPDAPSTDGAAALIDVHTHLARHRRLLPPAPEVPTPPVPEPVIDRPPIPWDERFKPAHSPSASAVTRATILIRDFLDTSSEPAFLVAETALGPPGDVSMAGYGAEEIAEDIPIAIPFNASCDWKPERQLATYMLSNGSSSAPTYAAVDSLLAESPAPILVEACSTHPFYMITKLAFQPPAPMALVVTSRKGPSGTANSAKAGAAPAAKAKSGSKSKRCPHGSACPNKATTCKLGHSSPAAASGSSRPRQKPQASGARGNSSAPPRAAASVPKGWEPNQ